MKVNRISTNEQMQKVRQYYEKSMLKMAIYHIPIVTILGVIAMVLPYNIPVRDVPSVIKPLWNTYGLLFSSGAVYILIFRFTPFGRSYQRNVPIINAVKSYDKAAKMYEKWQKKKKKQALMASYTAISAGYDKLKEVPEYKELRLKISRDYKFHFGIRDDSEVNSGATH